MIRQKLICSYGLFAISSFVLFYGCAGSAGSGKTGMTLESMSAGGIIMKNKPLLEQGQYKKALQNFETAVKKYPTIASLRYWLGVARYKNGMHQEAVTALNKSFELGLYKTYHPTAYEYLGWAYHDGGQFSKAINSFAEALKLKPGNESALLGRGSAWRRMGMYDFAIKDLDQILTRNPRHGDALRNRAWAYYSKKEYDKAMADFEAAVPLLKDSFWFQEVLRGRAWTNRMKGNLDEAINGFTEAIEVIKPQNAFALEDAAKGRAWAYYYKGDFKSAEDDFTKALQYVSSNNKLSQIEIQTAKAFCRLGLDDSETAIDIIRKTEQYYTQGSFPKQMLSLVYFAIGDVDKAWELRGGRGMIGVNVQDYNANSVKGAIVESLTKDSPAGKAGITKDDVVVNINGIIVTSASDIKEQTAKLEPGKPAKITVLRQGQKMEFEVEIASAEPLMKSHPLLEPISIKSKTASAASSSQSVITITPPAEPSGPDVSGAGDLSEIGIRETTVGKPSIDIDSVVIDPETVPAGQYFNVIIDFKAIDPESQESELTLTMNYSVSREGKLLKQFEPKEFKVPNGEHWTINRKPKAAKAKGKYTMEVELEYKGQKAAAKADFSIE